MVATSGPSERLEEPLGSWIRGWRVQMRVIGALLMRELHTRYGRENIGYLWMFGEPLTLAASVTLLHASEKSHYGSDARPIPFAILGYTMFIMFRGCVNRAEGAIESNAPLLYHRVVTILDMMIARWLQEVAATFVTFVTLMILAIMLGYADPPARPLDMLVGVGYMAWFCLGTALCLCVITHDNKLVTRFIHPITYLLMPIAGAFYMLTWVPQPYRTYLAYIPLVQIFEQLRYGMFESALSDYVDHRYLLSWCMILTYGGLVGTKRLRRHVHLS